MAAVCGSTLQHARPARVAASQSRGLASSAAVAGRPLPKAASVACRAAPVRVCAAAAPSQQKIRIKLKSYWTDLLEVSVDMIKDAASSTGAAVSGPVNLPTKRRIYTVLRSPHVNKDSREQFEVRTHQRLVDIKDLSAETIEKLMALDVPAGVDVEVKL